VQSLFRRWARKWKPSRPNLYPIRSDDGTLFLQPITSDEISLIKKWFQNRETCENAFGVKASWEVLEVIRTEYIEELQRDKVGVLSIRRGTSSEDSTTIGFVRYKLFGKGAGKKARVGIVLGSPEMRGRGMGRQAFNALIWYLFEKRDVQVIELDTALFNTKAQDCFSACGFKAVREVEFQGIHHSWKEKRLVMRLSRKEWNPISPR